jgi:hypothetical protein
MLLRRAILLGVIAVTAATLPRFAAAQNGPKVIVLGEELRAQY